MPAILLMVLVIKLLHQTANVRMCHLVRVWLLVVWLVVPNLLSGVSL